MKNTFLYHSKIAFLILGILLLSLLMGIFILIIVKSEKMTAMFYTMPILIGLSILYIVLRAFFTKVSIDDEGIVYSSLFRKVKIQFSELQGMVIVEKKRRRAPRFLKYSRDFTPTNFMTAYFFLFLKAKEIPQNPYFLQFKPASKDYITVQFRAKINDLIKEKIS